MSKFGFGSTPASPASTGFSFGTPKTTAPAFGTPTATGTPQGGFGAGNMSFGANTSNVSFGAPPANSTLNFGTPASGFGATTPAKPTFGTPATSSFGAPAAGSAFGTPVSNTGFGAAAIGSSFNTPSTNIGFGATNTAFTATTTAAAPAFGATSLSFGGANTFGSAAATGTGLFGSKPAGLGGFGISSTIGTANTTTITTPASQGLGGIDTTASKPSGINSNRNEDPPVRENQLPNEISTTVDSFKQFVKEQRLLSADIARGSIEPVQKVSEEVSTLQGILSALCSDIQKNAFSTDRLKTDMSTALGHAEMAQRTHEVPAGLQYENTAPLTYFMELVQSYERELLLFREKIELTDKHLHSLVQPKQVGEQDLTQGMRQIHETLITLAGRLQGVHHEVQAQKQMYLQLRRVVLDDGTDVFATKNRGNYQSPVKRGGAGPTPFVPGGLLGSGLNPKQLTSMDNKSTQIFNNTSIGGSSWGWSKTPIGAGVSSTTAFGSSASTGDTFNLQRPPIGNKRGKHY